MRKSYIVNSFLLLFILFISLNIFSCSSTKKVKYFQDIPDSGVLKTISKVEYSSPQVEVDDILTILVETVDPQATAMINLGNVSVSSSGGATGVQGAVPLSQQTSSGYLVDKQGQVEIPVLGKVSVVGLTTGEVRDVIRKEALKYFKEPTVIVRFANFKVSVTGEVLKPGQYIMPNEKVSIIDALAMAGDLTVFGKRDNVLLIRQNADGTKTPYRINLKSSNAMSSPYYYLKQNDIIYVEPGKGKAAANDASQAKYFAILGSLLSVLIVFLSRR